MSLRSSFTLRFPGMVFETYLFSSLGQAGEGNIEGPPSDRKVQGLCSETQGARRAKCAAPYV